jgi:DNA-binding transcriptional ArsR family regulator
MSRPGRTMTAPPRPARALVRNMSAAAAPATPQAPEVVLDARPAVDFLVSLMLDTDPELLAADRELFAQARASLSEHLKRDFVRVVGDEQAGKGIGGALVTLALPDPAIRTVADVVALANRTTARDLVAALYCDEDDAAAVALTLPVLDGDAAGGDAAIAAWPDHCRPFMTRLIKDPDGELRALRRVVRAWSERFGAFEERVAAMEQRDVDSRRADLGRLPLEEFVERCTGGVRWVPTAETRRLILSPSYFSRPYNYVFGGRDWHMFAYPLAEEAIGADADAVPAASVRLFKALGDESRLRILRLLSSGDLYLTEIADRMNLSKPTISHHLALLRAAGLVTITEAGNLTYYSLRRDRLADAGAELTLYLGGPSH